MLQGQVLNVILLGHSIRLSGHLSFLTSRQGVGCSPSHPLQVSCDRWSLSQGLLHAEGDSSGSALDGSPEELDIGLQRPPRQPHGERTELRPIPILLPGKFHGQRSLVGYSPWGRKELDTTERLTLPLPLTETQT